MWNTVKRRADYIVVAVAAGLSALRWFEPHTLLAYGDFHPLGFIAPGVLSQKVSPLWNAFTDGLGGRGFSVGSFPWSYCPRLWNGWGGAACRSSW